MQLFGFEIRRKAANLVPIRSSSWFSVIQESFAGAWQRNVEVESEQNILAFSAVYSCVSLIANDIAKLRIRLMERDDAIWEELDAPSPFAPVLRKPNTYQTRQQFMLHWLASKLLYGNTYALKERDQRGIVTSLYVLDPRLVTPLVADNGDVYYQLRRDPLSEVMQDVTIPASEIIHDRMVTLWHPLVGVSPIYACGASATVGVRIQANSSKFFENMSRPSGQLTAPGAISDENAKRLKAEFESNFSGSKIGRLLVTGDGLKYEPMAMPADDAQLIEQLKWTVEDVARAFHVPLYKLGIAQPTLSSVGQLAQDYYSQALQAHIEAIELLLDEGLGLPVGYGAEFDLDGLLRMDPLSRADRNEKAIRAGYLTPNEARESENLEPVEGGQSPYLQQQNYSLAALAKRDAQADPFAPAGVAPAIAPPAEPEDEAEMEDEAEAMMAAFGHSLVRRFAETAYAP